MYLVKREVTSKNPKDTAHIWTGEDTVCKMYSTGGLPLDRKIVKDLDGRKVCLNCSNLINR